MRKRTSLKQEDVAHAVSLFFAVRRLIRTELAKGKKVDPSTWVQMETMQFIADHDKPKMKDVADYLSITAPSATSLVRGLVKSGLVLPGADRRDRRTSRLTLTARGKAELTSATARNLQILGRLFSALSKAEFTAFAGALERVKEKVTKR